MIRDWSKLVKVGIGGLREFKRYLEVWINKI